MSDYPGTTGPLGSWEENYRKIPALELPWNPGMVDGDLREWVEKAKLPPGKAYDLGCGTGNDSAYLAGKGWDVTAVDIAPSAIALARETAQAAGVEGKIRFLVSDVLALEKAGDADLLQDRGCFHTLPSGLWGDYRLLAAGLLKKGGTLALKVFSFKMPEGPGPRRFTPEEIQKVFAGLFQLEEAREGVFHGPRQPRSLFCRLTKISG